MRPMTAITWCSVCLLLVGCALPTAALPAFPGAEGWGTDTPGGRGGKIIFVTNLNDDGPGSFREALNTEGPRIILFRVSGVIQLEKSLVLGGTETPEGDNRYSYVTVAGHSAPGGGIIIAGQTFYIARGVHDVVLRHLRFRNARRSDGISFLNGSRRVVVDHCSVSWATDENFGFFGDNKEITVQYSTIAEGLMQGEHSKGGHSMGMLVSRGAHHVSIHHNYLASNNNRNPQLVGNNLPDRERFGLIFPVFDVRNNVVYNYRIGTNLSLGAQANIVANVYVAGPDTGDRPPIMLMQPHTGNRAYLEANIGPGLERGDQRTLVRLVRTMDEGDIPREPGESAVVETPFAAAPVTTLAPDQVVDRVVPIAGALPHDPTDLRLIEEFRTKTGACGAPQRTHDSPIPAPAPGNPAPDADNDGMPDAWEGAHGLNPRNRKDAHGDRDADGYTNVEEYLNDVAERLEKEAAARW